MCLSEPIAYTTTAGLSRTAQRVVSASNPYFDNPNSAASERRVEVDCAHCQAAGVGARGWFASADDGGRCAKCPFGTMAAQNRSLGHACECKTGHARSTSRSGNAGADVHFTLVTVHEPWRFALSLAASDAAANASETALPTACGAC